jgi:hypothetical protein
VVTATSTPSPTPTAMPTAQPSGNQPLPTIPPPTSQP